MSFANSDSFTSSFPTWIPFIYFPYLIAVSRTTDTMLDKGGQRRRHPDLRGNIFRFPPLVEFLALMLPTGLSYMDFIILRYVPSIPTLLRVFNPKWILLFFSSSVISNPTLCNPIDCSMPGFPVHHQLPELTQTHVHRGGDTITLR